MEGSKGFGDDFAGSGGVESVGSNSSKGEEDVEGGLSVRRDVPPTKRYAIQWTRTPRQDWIDAMLAKWSRERDEGEMCLSPLTHAVKADKLDRRAAVDVAELDAPLRTRRGRHESPHRVLRPLACDAPPIGDAVGVRPPRAARA